MSCGFDIIGWHGGEGGKVVENAGELGGEPLHLRIRDCDPRKPRDMEDVSGGQ